MSFNKQPNLIEDGFISGIGNKIKAPSVLTSDTNMMPEYFANLDKLIPEEDRIYFNRDNNDDDDDDYETRLDDDNIDKYKTDKPNIFATKQEHQKQSEKHSDKPSAKYSTKYSQQSQHSSGATETEGGREKEKAPNPDDESQWTEEELFLRKMDMLRKLGELAQAGVKLSQNYSMEHDYKTMKFEYELHTGIRSKTNAVNFLSGMLIGIVRGMEMLNDNYNPFDIKFENTWSNNVTTGINDYYDVLGEIYEKYTKPGQKMAPELKLFLMLSGSAITIQMHRGIKNLIPQVSQNLNNDPNMVENLRKEAETRQRDQEAREKSRHDLNERLEKDHANASAQVTNLTQLNSYRKEYNAIQQKAQNSETDNFANGLVLSDTATESIRPPKNKNSQSKQSQPIQKIQQNQQFQPQINQMQQMNQMNQIFYQKQMEEKQRQELIAQNNKLLEMEQMLKNMNNEEAFVDHHIKQNKQVKPPKQLQGIQKQRKLQDSDNVSRSSNRSSSSRISVNPNLDKIFNDEESEESEKLSRSSKVSKKSNSSKKSEIMLNIDDELDNLNLDSSESLHVIKEDDDDFPETISFSKKSTGSGKRGRPLKSGMKIKIGK
jgi:hypothetical protein